MRDESVHKTCGILKRVVPGQTSAKQMKLIDNPEINSIVYKKNVQINGKIDYSTMILEQLVSHLEKKVK